MTVTVAGPVSGFMLGCVTAPWRQQQACPAVAHSSIKNDLRSSRQLCF